MAGMIKSLTVSEKRYWNDWSKFVVEVNIGIEKIWILLLPIRVRKSIVLK